MYFSLKAQERGKASLKKVHLKGKLDTLQLKLQQITKNQNLMPNDVCCFYFLYFDFIATENATISRY